MSTLLELLVLLLVDAIKSQLAPKYSLDLTLVNGSHPNIIFILTDDWGINDVGWTHHNTDTLTPYLDNLAQTEGLILTNYYAERVCTASRAAFLSGRYPSHLGLQSGVCAANQPASLTRQVSMLSNEFQSAGYSTHLIGKWHLGMMAYEYTPTYRGFDSFYGYWAGGEDYFNHRSWSFMRQVSSTDLFINEKPALYQYGNTLLHPYDGVYGVWWQQSEALKLLQSKASFPGTAPPFFFYFALQASHSPRQAPVEYMAMYADGRFGDNNNRVTFQAQTSTADDAIKAVVEYLKSSQLWDNTLVLVTSDNGGKRHFGDNAPYRGFKNTSWEGGVKVPGFVTGGYLDETQRGEIMNYPIHIVDWYPTLLSAAGLDINYERSRRLYEIEENFDALLQVFKEDKKWDETEETEVDGIDIWDYIQGNAEDAEYFDTAREILLDLKEVWCPFKSCGALRIGRYKFIRGDNVASLLPDYTDGDKWFRGYALNNSVAEIFCHKNSDTFMEKHGVNTFEINSIECANTENGCLFDLELDACEYYDLSALYPDILRKFKNRLNEFEEMAAIPLMGEQNAAELFGKDVIEPDRVCHNPTFWCPFKMYKDVEFEYKLFDKALKSLNGGNEFEHNSTAFALDECVLYIVIPLCVALIVIGCFIYCCCCKKKPINNDIVGDVSEVQPLKHCNNDNEKRSGNSRMVNVCNGGKIDYGSTATTIK